MRLIGITKSYSTEQSVKPGAKHGSKQFSKQCAKQGVKTVFSGLDLTLPSRGAVWIMGESGCGKTTLLRIIAGLESFEGTIEDIPPGGVSMVFQEDRLFEELSPEDNCLLACSQKGEARKDTRQRIRQMLTATGIPEEDITRPVSGFSGGMKRRTAIVRALCAPSGLVLMDEPFTGIDRENRLATGKVIRENLGDRLFIGVTHHREDASLIEGETIVIVNN